MTEPTTAGTTDRIDPARRALRMLDVTLPDPARSPLRANWQPPDAAELQSDFPGYEIRELVGRGGMGAVYRGWQRSLEREVAVKILPAGAGPEAAAFAARFTNEARTMARLKHPGIVAVHDFGETASGLLYIVMEFVGGTDVAKLIVGAGRLHSDEATAITAHVCDALAYAHQRGVIHRDIKPANIMIDEDGVVKVADFGLAKLSGGMDAGLTQSGTALGTPYYMAPETVADGAAVDARADIYATGVMLYHMLTGKVPQGMFELPSMQVRGLDPRFDGIVARALRENREERYADAREMRADLDGMMTQPVQRMDIEGARSSPALAGKMEPPAPAAVAAHPVQRGGKRLALWCACAVVMALAGFAVHRGLAPRAGPAPSAAADADAPFTNSLGMRFVPVPGTSVLFCIHETRKQDYAAFAKEVEVDALWSNAEGALYLRSTGDDLPVTCVTYGEARDFCDWLSRKEGRAYRLPTDREWSFAAGIGEFEDENATPFELSARDVPGFPWGGDREPAPGELVGNYGDESFNRIITGPGWNKGHIAGYDDGFPAIAPVMSFKPNKLGIYDLGGNMWEVTDTPYGRGEDLLPRRGGAWNDGRFIPANDRLSQSPTTRLRNYGFRIVLQAPSAQ